MKTNCGLFWIVFLNQQNTLWKCSLCLPPPSAPYTVLHLFFPDASWCWDHGKKEHKGIIPSLHQHSCLLGCMHLLPSMFHALLSLSPRPNSWPSRLCSLSAPAQGPSWLMFLQGQGLRKAGRSGHQSIWIWDAAQILCASLAYTKPWIQSPAYVNWVLWHMPVISTLKKWEQEVQKFRVILGCIVLD